MPNITVQGPIIHDIDVKRSLVKDLTDALEKAYKLPREIMIVLIKENPPENVGVGGQLIVDRMKEKS